VSWGGEWGWGGGGCQEVGVTVEEGESTASTIGVSRNGYSFCEIPKV